MTFTMEISTIVLFEFVLKYNQRLQLEFNERGVAQTLQMRAVLRETVTLTNGLALFRSYVSIFCSLISKLKYT